MSDSTVRMLDLENVAKDRYEYNKELLVALMENNISKAKTIIEEDMRIYEEEYLEDDSNDSKDNVIELSKCRQTN